MLRRFHQSIKAVLTKGTPTIEEEDAKRQHREREHLVQERVRIENRIAALFTVL